MKKYLIIAGVLIVVYFLYSGYKKGLINQAPKDPVNRSPRDSSSGLGSQINYDPTLQARPLEPAEIKPSLAERYSDPDSIPVLTPQQITKQ